MRASQLTCILSLALLLVVSVALSLLIYVWGADRALDRHALSLSFGAGVEVDGIADCVANTTLAGGGYGNMSHPCSNDTSAYTRPAVAPGRWTSETMEPNFAYAQYATDLTYFCNALINAGRLKRYGAKHDIVILYPEEWDSLAPTSPERSALAHALTLLPTLILHPMHTLHTSLGDPAWSRSLSKFAIFLLSAYSRVLYFDSDSLVLNAMDHYFLAPLARIAIPRAYWLGEKANSGPDSFRVTIAQETFGSHVMLVQPHAATYAAIRAEAERSGAFDMEVVNELFGRSAMILPHRRLALLTGEFRTRDHARYLADEPDAEWNAMGEVSRSVLVHFSDWPLPKPWMPRSQAVWDEVMPTCDPDNVPEDRETRDRPQCADRTMWTGFYKAYDREKANVCDGKW